MQIENTNKLVITYHHSIITFFNEIVNKSQLENRFKRARNETFIQISRMDFFPTSRNY